MHGFSNRSVGRCGQQCKWIAWGAYKATVSHDLPSSGSDQRVKILYCKDGVLVTIDFTLNSVACSCVLRLEEVADDQMAHEIWGIAHLSWSVSAA